jgi:hypothetical protein
MLVFVSANNQMEVGKMRATVKFNGHRYEGEVLKTYGSRAVIRFTTGSGRTRERRFTVVNTLDRLECPGKAAFIHGTASGELV